MAAAVAYFSLIYGSGSSLEEASPQMHLQALDRSTAVACCFLLVALAVVVADLRRRRVSTR